jgi:alpha-glucuronidase
MDPHDVVEGARRGGRDPRRDAALARGLRGLHDAAGLHHLIGGDHYAPMPENADARRADWTATYYHRADASGIGFDRTRTGSDGVSQYRSPLREQWADPATVPRTSSSGSIRVPVGSAGLRSGRTLWDELVAHYAHGADEARAFEERWEGLRGKGGRGAAPGRPREAASAGRRGRAVARQIVGYFRTRREAAAPAASPAAP